MRCLQTCSYIYIRFDLTIKDLVNDINEGEHKLRANIEKNLIDYKQKVELLQMQLQLSLSDDELRYNATSTSGSLLDECRHYKSLYLKLLDIKKERKNRYTSLMNRQNELCSVLNERPYEFASNSMQLHTLFEHLSFHL